MTLRELGFDSDVLASGLTCDSREVKPNYIFAALPGTCLLYTSPSPRDATLSRMPSSA